MDESIGHQSRDSEADGAFAPNEPPPLADFIGRRAAEGCLSGEPGVRFVRLSRPMRCRKQHALGPTLSIVGQGEKRAFFGDQSLRYDPTHYLLVTGETDYEVEALAATAARPHLEAIIDIPIDLVVKTLMSISDAHGLAPTVRDTPPAFVSRLDEPLHRALCRLFATLDDPLERRILFPLVIEELVFHLLRSDAAATLRRAVGGRDAKAVYEAMRFMRAHHARALSVGEVARAVGMSASHFAHRFSAVARQTPMRYLKLLRLQEARNVLLLEQRVAEAAARVGYQSASHFTRDFKRTFGVSPAEHARRFRQLTDRDSR